MSNNLTVKQSDLCRKLDVVFQEPRLLEQALTHRSVGSFNNERLEYLGDAILNFVIAETLYKHFPKEKEGKLSRLRASLVKGITLAEIGRELDLGTVLILGPGELKSGGFRRESILADAVEAIFGAVYLDGGMDASKALILHLFEERIKAIDISEADKDPKTTLQEYLQSRKQPLPIYEVKDVTTTEKQPVFEASCQISLLNKLIVAKGTSHRKAEQAAANRVLKIVQGM